MDSMRSLNRSLPSTPSGRPAPPEQLLQAFRQAALSVTNLYKSAASDHDQIRQAGYQDALDDLLKFLDRENLGLQDGEGWRVRQWATARYDGSPSVHQSESEDEQLDSEQRQRSLSPDRPNEEEEAQPSEEATAPPLEQDQNTHESDQPQPVFHFSAGGDNMQTDISQSSNSESRTSLPPVRLDIVNRANRNAHKHNSRHGTRQSSRNATPIAGSKRKVPFPDISEIFNVSGKTLGREATCGNDLKTVSSMTIVHVR